MKPTLPAAASSSTSAGDRIPARASLAAPYDPRALRVKS